MFDSFPTWSVFLIYAVLAAGIVFFSKKLADYVDALDKILSRVTFIGAMALGIIALVPSFTSYLTKITTVQGIGATSLIIMVGVALETVKQMESQMMMRHYKGFLD